MPIIQFKSYPLRYTLRRSARAKRLQMIVRQAQFEVVAPTRINNRTILAFVFSHQDWMLKQYLKQKKRQVVPTLWPKTFETGEMVYFRGQPCHLNIKFGPLAKESLQENSLFVTVPWQTLCVEVMGQAKEQLIAWYQREAAKIVEKNVSYYSDFLGRWPKKVRLKQQKTRWGSCGVNENIYINWLLVLAPPGVLEYVVVHELCHLFHRNHGKRFWQKVAACMPQYKEQEKWLSQHGHILKLII